MSAGTDFIWGWEQAIRTKWPYEHRHHVMIHLARILKNYPYVHLEISFQNSGWMALQIQYKEGPMTAKNGKKQTPWNKKIYVKVELNGDERDEVRELANSGIGVMDALDRVVEAGYVIRIGYDAKTDRIKLSVDGDATEENHGLVLEQNGSDPRTTFAAALYKVAHKCDMKAWRTESVDGSWFD